MRYEVVIAIVSTAKKDFDIVARSEDLLNFVKERTLDKKFKIRKEAMSGLAMIYKRQLSHPQDVQSEVRPGPDGPSDADKHHGKSSTQ